MTKKDFEIVAVGLCMARPDEPEGSHKYEARYHTVAVMTKTLATQNPRFNPEAFRKVCMGPK